MLPPVGFVHAQIINIQGFHVGEHVVAHMLLEAAEAMAQHLPVFVRADEHRRFFVAENCLQFFFGILGGGAFEQIGPDAVVHHVHLNQ